MIPRGANPIEIPNRLASKLAGFRRALLARVIRDGITWIMLAALLMLLTVFVLDRIFDTPAWFRASLLGLIGVAAGSLVVRIARANLACRSPLRIAKVIAVGEPLFGDHLVGALELAGSESEQARSATLCAGALEQVADDAGARDLREALPESRWHLVIRAAIALMIVLAFVLLISPQSVRNAAARLLTPFSDTPRYTFVMLDGLPGEIVVPRDEASRWTIDLDSRSRWNPSQATLWIGGRERTAEREVAEQALRPEGTAVPPEWAGAKYRFEIPRLIDTTSASLRVGDATGKLKLIPKTRPDLNAIRATVRYPDYLIQRQADRETEVEMVEGVIKVIQGSVVTLQLDASSELSGATVDGDQVIVEGSRFTVTIPGEAEKVEINWIDTEGLEASEPLTVNVRQVPDQRPTLLVEAASIPDRVLDSQPLRFELTAQDDIAVRQVGLEWTSGTETGQRIVGSGDNAASLSAVFQATALSVPPGSVGVRFWVEDDFPGRQRVYSEPISLIVLSPDEHAVWIADQFARWRQAAMDVRDRELNLFGVNRELASTEIKDRDEAWREAVGKQAAAEQFNGRELHRLTDEGQELLRQAARNSEVAVGYVEKLAQTIETLEQLADERMPKIAELLNQASEDQEEESKFSEVVDVESSQGAQPDEQPAAAGDGTETEPSSEETTERLGLAGTTIIDTSKRDGQEQKDEEEDPLSSALEDQTDLVSEFEAVAEELRELLGNMEGSTLVKRLKSVSRLQDRVALQLGKGIEETFGQSQMKNESLVKSVAADVADSAARVRTVLDDLDAFCQRREIEHFASVLAEMKEARVLQQLSDLQDQVARRPGVSISIAEYWADNLDRWADNLVDPGSGQQQKGSKSKKSLSPAVILEVLRILETEVNLREQTRVAEQGRGVMASDEYKAEAIRLSEAQDLLRDRLDVVVQGLERLPEGILNFGTEIEILGMASAAMVDATKTLVSPETGPVAVAAQTEAIELMLRSKKVSPEGGGGGGGNAGGGEGGQTDQAAIAMLGRGLDALAKGRDSDTELEVGRDRGEVPEQWREGLDRYFDRLERRRMGMDGGTN